MDNTQNVPRGFTLYLCWAIMATALLASLSLAGTRDIPLARALAELPQSIGDWTMVGELDPEKLATALRADDIFVRRYRNSRGQTAELYAGYFGHVEAKKAPHAPQLCWVGSGWSFKSLGETQLVLDSMKTPFARVRQMIATKGDNRVMLFYCYKLNDDYFSDLTAFRIAAAFDTIFKRRNAAFTLQVTSPMPEGAPPEAEENLRRFVTQVLSILEEKHFA